ERRGAVGPRVPALRKLLPARVEEIERGPRDTQTSVVRVRGPVHVLPRLRAPVEGALLQVVGEVTRGVALRLKSDLLESRAGVAVKIVVAVGLSRRVEAEAELVPQAPGKDFIARRVARVRAVFREHRVRGLHHLLGK